MDDSDIHIDLDDMRDNNPKYSNSLHSDVEIKFPELSMGKIGSFQDTPK
jgi:hypothetical protein